MNKLLALLILITGLLIVQPATAQLPDSLPQDSRPMLAEDTTPDTSIILPATERKNNFSLNSLFRGMLGMTVLILIGFLDRKSVV